ncbi:formylglycine-generating enzyme family protein [Paenibacillus pini]|nr:formylglycine-generating enzyme family protein [Paenibacillus pini]
MMIHIPKGEIRLRDDRIKHTWNVEIKPFLLSKYPVTQEFYFAVTQQSPSFCKGEQHPVENVSWNDAVYFCNLLSRELELKEYYSISSDGKDVSCDLEANGYRLPTEAEWQYACIAGTTQVRYGEIDDIAWYKENSGDQTHEVGNKESNAWGLYDMLGNVWEWCWDVYDEKVYGSYRIFRGGGWCDPERGCLATNRRRGHPTFSIDDLGFRIAKSL